MIRRWLSRIAIRLLLFNILLVFLPVAGLFSLRSLEEQLLDLQERSMVQQGRLVAASLSAQGEALDPANALRLIQQLGGRSESRIRIADRRGTVIADSAASRGALQATAEEAYAYPGSDSESRKRLLYRIGVTLWRPLAATRDFFERISSSPSPPSPDVTPRAVVRKALDGRYGATVRESTGQRSLTLYSALPIREPGTGRVIGAVIVSQSTSRILRALWRVRLDTFQVFAISVLVAVVLSLLVSATIARPLVRLRDEADDLLDHRGRLRKTFRGSRRQDEIGDLTRALEKLTARLERHLAFVESFSADVSHEFKNPLASIRNAAELLEQSEGAEREELTATIEKEVVRLNRLLNGVREVTKVDAAVEMEAATPVNVSALVEELAASWSAHPSKTVRIDVSGPAKPLLVAASYDRLQQAFGNVIDNAVSFSPTGALVQITLREVNGEALLHVDDEGPGIPEEHLERVFDRFFSFRTDRPEKHDGLGLSIARAIIEGYGGTIRAMNRTPQGARIEVRLPVVRAA